MCPVEALRDEVVATVSIYGSVYGSVYGPVFHLRDEVVATVFDVFDREHMTGVRYGPYTDPYVTFADINHFRVFIEGLIDES